MAETWRHVVGFVSYYEVSNNGRVRSTSRSVPSKGGRRIVKGQVLKLIPRNDGYLQATLSKRGIVKTFLVHKLVLDAFVGPCPANMECRHLNGNKADNSWPSNIVWGTPSDNNLDTKWYRTGSWHKNSPARVQAIRLALQRQTGAAVARQFGLNPATVSAIKHRRIHKDVP